MTLFLDTAILINLERKNKEVIKKIETLIEIDPAPANIGLINYFEFMHGLQKKSPQNREKSLAFVEKFPFVEATKKTAVILSDLKYKYEKLGKSFSLSDLIIASQAIENNMTLVTTDKQFESIEELKKVIL